MCGIYLTNLNRNKDDVETIFKQSLKDNSPIEAVNHFAGLKAVADSVINPLTYWTKIKDENNLFAGYISSAVWSPEFKKNIAIGMVEKDFWNK